MAGWNFPMLNRTHTSSFRAHVPASRQVLKTVFTARGWCISYPEIDVLEWRPFSLSINPRFCSIMTVSEWHDPGTTIDWNGGSVRHFFPLVWTNYRAFSSMVGGHLISTRCNHRSYMFWNLTQANQTPVCLSEFVAWSQVILYVLCAFRCFGTSNQTPAHRVATANSALGAVEGALDGGGLLSCLAAFESFWPCLAKVF